MAYLKFSQTIKTKEEADEELSINKLTLDICGLDTFGALIVKIDVDPYDRWELFGIIPHNTDKDNYYVQSFVVSTRNHVFYLRDYFPGALLTIEAIEFLNPKE
jgi:hypothetical protein